MNVHSLKSALGYHFSARRGVYFPLLASTSSRVSRNGSYWRWSGRETIQKRLLSENPAEANTSRSVLLAWANPGVGMVTRVNTSATSSPGTSETNLGFIAHLLLRFVPQKVTQRLKENLSASISETNP